MSSSGEVERAVRGTIAAVFRASLVRGACHGAAAGLALAGVGVLVLRFGVGLTTVESLWALAVLPVAILIASMGSLSRLTPDEAKAWLDDRWNCGGLLMLESETWADRFPQIRPPRVQWFDRSLGIMLSVLAVFLLGAFMIPTSSGSPEQRGFNLEPVVNTLAEEIELLEEVEAIEPEEAEQLAQELEQLLRLAKSDDPAQTWEALDHARQELDRLAEQAGDTLADQASRSAAIEELASQIANMLEQSPEGLSAEQAEAMRQALEQLDHETLPEAVREAMSRLSESLSESQSQQNQAAQGLCEAAGQCSGGAMSGLGQLASGGMIDPSRLGQARADRDAARQALRELMETYSQGECESGEMLAMLSGMCAGSGGINRGPGAAALSWRDHPSELDAEFEPVLVDSQAVDQEQSIFLSDGAALPDGEQPGAGSSGGAIDTTRAAESRSSTPLVLPRHREAVRRYFERADSSEEPGE